jgi:predicted ATP-dependent serine protease
MTNVACFCGCVYSFSGAVGACPNCGEYTTFTSVGVEEERQMRRELDAVLRPH